MPRKQTVLNTDSINSCGVTFTWKFHQTFLQVAFKMNKVHALRKHIRNMYRRHRHLDTINCTVCTGTVDKDFTVEDKENVQKRVFCCFTQLYTVWSWLPPRFAVCQPELLYTSEEHGTSLMTLYTRVEDHQPTLIVIKTTNDEVFGAFCSTYWRDRKHRTKNLSYFGTGETFIFTLNPKKQKYSWVGLQQEDIPNTANMFLAGDNSMLTIGGGNGEAIQLDANLLHCRTEKCDTFHNEPLCTEEDFTCKVVEVYGFV